MIISPHKINNNLLSNDYEGELTYKFYIARRICASRQDATKVYSAEKKQKVW